VTSQKPIVVAGHQPNFFPWFGYFEKMLKCDIFVFSDDVQYPKQCYANRVEIPINKQPAYLTLPVSKGDDDRIADKRYQKDKSVLKKLIKTIHFNLGGFPYSSDIAPILDEFAKVYMEYTTIGLLNSHMNEYIASFLGINVETRMGTDLKLEPYHKNERLIHRCQLLDSSVYLCGQGADCYQNEAQINEAGITLRRIDYSIGKEILGDNLQYSILVGIARVGVQTINEAIEEYKRGGTQ